MPDQRDTQRVTDGALLLDAGALMPPRYPRMIDYANSIDVDPGVLLTVLLGVRPYSPDDVPAPEPDPNSLRRQCDRGEATWAQALGEMTSLFPLMCGREWDAQGYGHFLASGPGPALRLDACGVVLDAVAAGIDVVIVVTGPAEFAAGMTRVLPEGARIVFSHALGAARPDPRVWVAAAEAAHVTASQGTWCIVTDTWDSHDALGRSDLAPVARWDATADDMWMRQVREQLGLPPSRAMVTDAQP